MLVLTRKKDQSIIIGDDIEIKLTGLGSRRARIGILAPADVRIRRKEVVERDECADGVIQNASIPDADDQLFG
jgi:carbon storage regulator